MIILILLIFPKKLKGGNPVTRLFSKCKCKEVQDKITKLQLEIDHYKMGAGGHVK